MTSENRTYLTNNHSILSKYSAIKKGYFQDGFLERFIEGSLKIERGWKRTPLVNRGYAARLLAIDWLVSRTIKIERIDCVIVLGAGYDTLSLRNLKSCSWIEIDLPKVAQAKAQFVNEHEILDSKLILDGDTYSQDGLTHSQYNIISGDMRESARLESNLQKLLTTKITSKRRVLILNEVCLCYLELEEVRKTMETVISSLKLEAWRIHYIGYEQFKPLENSHMSTIMEKHFQSLGHPLKYFPSSREMKIMFKNHLNFDHITISSMYQIFNNALYESVLEINAFEEDTFDEFEEMDLYLSHYALVSAVMILKDPFLNTPTIDSAVAKCDNNDLSANEEDEEFDSVAANGFSIEPKEVNIRRYGHASCALEGYNKSDLFFITGGFGIGTSSHPSNQHRRLSECQVVALIEDSLECRPVSSDFGDRGICLDRMHGQVSFISSKQNGGLLFFNGGRQSPIKHRSSNLPFIAQLTRDYDLGLKHLFQEANSSPPVWRHKLSRCLRGDRLFQVGGISLEQPGEYSALLEWNLSSSELGCRVLSAVDEQHLEHFRRHSFGMDISENESTMFILGGLKASELGSRYRPVEKGTILFDLRTNNVSHFELDSAHCYAADVHFINDHQLLKIGGISTRTGLLPREPTRIELIDLRNRKSVVEKNCRSSGELLLNTIMSTNSTTCHLRNSHEIYSLGGGGNFFTFGTYLNILSARYRY